MSEIHPTLTQYTELAESAGSFIHEITHVKPNAVPGFYWAWNALVGVPLTASTASTFVLKTLSKNPASPATILTLYVPLGTAISHRAFGFAGFSR